MGFWTTLTRGSTARAHGGYRSGIRRRRWVTAAVGAVIFSLVASGCASSGTGSRAVGFGDCSSKPNDCNSAKTKAGGTIAYAIEKKISGWNVNNARSLTFEFQEVLDGVLQNVFNTNPDFSEVLNKDLMISAEQTSASPQTIVYKIRPEAVWNDGAPVNAEDFIYEWKTMNGKDCRDCLASNSSGWNQLASVTGSDDGKTVTAIFKTPYTDWKSLFGGFYPAHIAAQHGDLAASFTWFDKNPPTYSNGPYSITGYEKDVSVTETPNPKWYGATKPSLDKLIFRIITDQTQEVPALENNEVQAIYPQPNQDIVGQVKQLPGVKYNLSRGLVWEHLDLNLKNPFFQDVKLRQALFTAINRGDVLAKTIGQFAPSIEPMNSHNFVPGQEGYQDVVSPTGQGSGDLKKAKALLAGAGYTGIGTALKTPAGKAAGFRCSFTEGNTLRQQTCELIQSELSDLGIKVTPTPVASLGSTLAGGDYDMILFAWIGTPFAFANAYQLYGSTSAANYGHWVNAESDKLLTEAAGQTNRKTAIDYLNQADEIMSKDAYTLPLFQKPTLLAVSSSLVNIRDNPTNSGPPYNVQEWGVQAS